MTYEDLKRRQSWTLEQKIDHAVSVVSSFMDRVNGNIYASYSGGKDSEVMLDIIRRYVDKNVPAVFCNTGNEYPDVVKFVRQTDNLTVIRPDMRIAQIIEKYGFPLVSKEQRPKIYGYFMQMKNSGISYRAALRYCSIDFSDSINKQLKFDV
jgi:3'-phosphoadenosine 5'-phosphosulfate sulfotransferase (PAPS reductase)/FAD synthetase